MQKCCNCIPIYIGDKCFLLWVPFIQPLMLKCCNCCYVFKIQAFCNDCHLLKGHLLVIRDKKSSQKCCNYSQVFEMQAFRILWFNLSIQCKNAVTVYLNITELQGYCFERCWKSLKRKNAVTVPMFLRYRLFAMSGTSYRDMKKEHSTKML